MLYKNMRYIKPYRFERYGISVVENWNNIHVSVDGLHTTYACILHNIGKIVVQYIQNTKNAFVNIKQVTKV